MSDNVGLEQRLEQMGLGLHLQSEDGTAQDFMKFCMQLIRHSHWKSRRIFYSGSYMEIPLYWAHSFDLGVNNEALDHDMMIYDTAQCAVHRSASLPESYTGNKIFRIYSDDTHAGYVRLINEKDSTEACYLDVYKLYSGDTRHGPAVRNDIRSPSHTSLYSLSNSAADMIENERITIKEHEMVYAIHSPYWPIEATEWIMRRRIHGFPSKSVIKQVLRYGCDFVQVSHDRLSNNKLSIEWRFSFSKAELIINKSWTISQRIVYDTLWVLNKRIASSNLCTYYFKTLLLWACEEKSVKFWDSKLIIYSIFELLIAVMECLRSKVCLNYFIPENNMMDHLTDTDLSAELAALWKTFQSDQRKLILNVIDTCKRNEFASINTVCHIELPAWILRAFVIFQRVDNGFDNYQDLFCTDLATELQNALCVELSDIYRGLCLHRQSASCDSASERLIYYIMSESHLLLATKLCESQESVPIRNCNQEFLRLMIQSFMTPQTGDTGGLSNDRSNILNDTGRSTAEQNKGKNINIDIIRVANGTYTEEFYKEWPGESPTVNISWFIAKAYLANLYYTIQHDISLTTKACDDIIEGYDQSFGNERFAERAFPVVLSTQWSNIYDKEIQELLGFYSLCSYVLDPSSPSVYLGICPVQFALYLKQRIAKDYVLDNWTAKLNEHRNKSICDPRFNNGTRIIQFAYTNFMMREAAKRWRFLRRGEEGRL